MSAAAVASDAAAEETDKRVAAQLQAFATKLVEHDTVGTLELRFLVDGTHEFSTLLHTIAGTYYLATEGRCIMFDVTETEQSAIKADSATNKCFRPILSRDTLPAGVTPTDVLQTLSTKLKFAVMGAEVDRSTIWDVARLPGHLTPLSAWRLLRGEPTLYEKYGFASAALETAREACRTMKWGALVAAAGSKLDRITSRFPTIFRPDRTIAECMKEISLALSESVEGTVVLPIMNALEEVGVLADEAMHVTVSRDSPVWQGWNARVRLFL